jgi:ABC-type nitrate/sulfonate/bicarbonate transport system permease component
MANDILLEEKLLRRILRLNGKILGLVLGILFGLTIFIGTNWLLIKEAFAPSREHIVGPHLQLLSQFFLGYRVSFLGSIIGFFYGFALGTLCGSAIGWIYNKIVDLKSE